MLLQYATAISEHDRVLTPKRCPRAASKNTDEVIEEIPIIIKSFCSAVIPKLLPDDLSLLQSLLRDVFPGAETPDFSDEVLKQAVCAVCDDWKFQSDNMWLEKVMQLNQIVNLHHGVMLVGPSSSGKSAAWRVLFEALTRSDVKAGNKPGCFHQIDPKALSKSALYGTLDPTTREWKDGIFTRQTFLSACQKFFFILGCYTSKCPH